MAAKRPFIATTTSWRPHLERLPLLVDCRPLAYALAIGFAIASLLLRWVLDDAFPPGYPYLTFFPAVILAAFLFGVGPGSVAAILCGLFAWWFFIPPTHSFALTGRTSVALGFYAGVVTVDIALIHAMQRATLRLAEARERTARLADRTELLFHELQHRVSNNLQMVGAMLGLQQAQVADPAARQALVNTATRIQLIGRIQRRLYATDGALVPLDAFVIDMAQDLVEASGQPGIACSVVAESGASLAPDSAIPVALILAEAIANAIEHGFMDRETGTIRIALTRVGEHLDLCIADDGAGLPAGFALAGTDSLGLEMAKNLAMQLRGTLTLEPGDVGTVMRLRLPGGGERRAVVDGDPALS